MQKTWLKIAQKALEYVIVIFIFFCLCLLVIAVAADAGTGRASGLDISPFALPRCAEGEVRFEEPRDIERVVVTFKTLAPKNAGISYMHKIWPASRIEQAYKGADDAMKFGWHPIEDWFNCNWQKAAINRKSAGKDKLEITFQGLTAEYPDLTDYNVAFRRTQGIRLDECKSTDIRKIEVYTTSAPAGCALRITLNAGAKSAFDQLSFTGYNAKISRLKAESGTVMGKNAVTMLKGNNQTFTFDATYMAPGHPLSGDKGLITFSHAKDAFTISLDSLTRQGPIWFADQGVFITRADDPTTFDDYRKQIQGLKTINQQVTQMPEQSLGGALTGQPAPHPDSFVIGCKNARQRFRIEPNGDLFFGKAAIDWGNMSDTPRYAADGNLRFFFGMEKMRVRARFPDTPPILAYNMHVLGDDIAIEQKSFATPLIKPLSTDQLVGSDTIIAVVQFNFLNTATHDATARLPVGFSTRSKQMQDRLDAHSQHDYSQTGYRVPLSKRDKLSIEPDGRQQKLTSLWNDQEILRCVVDTEMQGRASDDDILFEKTLKPGQSCTLTLKIPAISLTESDDLARLTRLDCDAAYKGVVDYWRAFGHLGAQINTPEPRLNALYKSHFAYISVADVAMPDDPYLINTSVASSIYGNYTNESCMIIEELDERGLHDEARRRLATWLKYQGTVGLTGNFSDHDGVFFGAGGFESGETYDQHHGWALWYLAKHFFITGDTEWMKSVADSMVKGADWVFRQRKQTLRPLPHSRGWEKGFLPAGSLEDVSDYFYWLSTNATTWRGVEYVARALSAIHHPQANRIRKESDAYKQDLIAGFERSRQMSPLVRLKDGRWVPHYPSRLYLRGRDTGWIREILEGAVYLIITGLYDPRGKQAGWILDDFQDNRYISPDYGYPIFDSERLWYDVAGFSCQPNLLPGLMPHLDRDEPEITMWMFFNAWAACYREDVNAMVEHPVPILGHSNTAIVKTSDEANAMKWLTYLMVYANDNTLHLGRAIPRQWFTDGQTISARGLSTYFGDVSLIYRSQTSAGLIRMEADLSMRNQPSQILAKFRHPDKLPIKSATVNGKKTDKIDFAKGDVDITGHQGKVIIEVKY